MADGPDSSSYMLANSASHLLRRLLQLAEDRFLHLAKANELNLRQFAVMAAIAYAPGLSQTDLVRATGIDRSTLADMMIRMQERGLIVRTTSKSDARANSVRLTAEGAAALATSNGHGKAADAAIMDYLSESKQLALSNTLKRILKRADEAAEVQEKKARKNAKRQAEIEARRAGKKAHGKKRGDKERGEKERGKKARGQGKTRAEKTEKSPDGKRPDGKRPDGKRPDGKRKAKPLADVSQ
ncbi:MAG: MarR family transcriptional regulator [Terricaulis sp.]